MSLEPEAQPKGAGSPRSRGAEREAFVTRLQHIVSHWRSADRLARAMDVSPSAFRKWLKGEAEPSRERLVALADAAGVSIAWLAKGEGPQPRLRNARAEGGAQGGLDPERFLVLPKQAEQAAAAAGSVTPAPPEGQASAFMAFGHDWIRHSFSIEPDDLMLETAVGESMVPTIQDGDLLLIDTTDQRFREFGIYVLEYAGQRLVKRVQRKLDGSLLLISDNAIYEPERIPPERTKEVKVLGRVVWCGGKL
ncbi:MAG TPA: S24 family peptidase [Acetobacteraceae bacterium]|nr:S24 family peptidase [Acetobacteraceae bacterium]